ncbi:CaiB/BaiF CoA transferase family protein [Pseudonocardia kunmingensis]|uniref:Crotonobetainyl-CoA:carnitine CoA-transferase CaiB-like acyl-CoA transferase n=1 Tax=Pseudonocardia kunmingensis TaxID=630975 RepID=A0A543DPH9_9PSEU|nr:CoA transferase [Pseudonocardia kunmingensis]TQM11236.1 crotonobetainyl-CoA:carnitine CoA-transferase CaiB-like acyl-CoA transferase [Pseudonocardia kunmingensis]
MTGSLDGIKVLDLTMWAFCPAAGAVLASWGADVVHVENPRSPDPMRLFGGGNAEPGGAHWMFRHYNRGKRGIALDLADPIGQEVLLRLAAEADVFLTSFLPATRRKLGFDIDQIRKVNPRIVYAKGTGAGPRGPEAGRGGYDGASWWARGSLAHSAMTVTGIDFAPGMVGHGDGMSGLVLAGGICSALFQRERTGVAPVVDSSLLGTAMWFNGPAVISAKMPGEQRSFGERIPREHTAWSSGTYRTRDGRFIYLSLLGDADALWVDLCAHLGREDLADDPRFVHTADRRSNNLALMDEIDRIFSTRDYADWTTALNTTRGVWAGVQSTEEIHDDPQAIANRLIQEVDYPDGPLAMPTPPLMFDEDPGDIRRAPDFGEHTADVLAEAGYDDAEIARLRERGVVA